VGILVDGVTREENVHRLDVGDIEVALFGELMHAPHTDLSPAPPELLA
jgi:hypothetical protein